MTILSDHIQDAVACLQETALVYEGISIDTKTEIISKLSFSRSGDFWEASSSAEGDVVVAIDCTQDHSILCAGKSRELVNHIQQLRKSAGLNLSETVETFFKEDVGDNSLEDAVSRNIELFRMKLKGGLPLPEQYAPQWSIKIASDTVDIGGSKVEVAIHRPSISVRDGLSSSVVMYFSTVDPSAIAAGSTVNIAIDGMKYSLVEGVDFWITAASKVQATKLLSWL